MLVRCNAGTMYIEFRWDGSPPLQDSGAARAVTAKYNPGHWSSGSRVPGLQGCRIPGFVKWRFLRSMNGRFTSNPIDLGHATWVDCMA